MENLKTNQKRFFSQDESLIYKSIFKLNPKIKFNKKLSEETDSINDKIHISKPNFRKKEYTFEQKLLKLKYYNREFYMKLNRISENAGIIYSKKYLESYLEEYHIKFENLLK